MWLFGLVVFLVVMVGVLYSGVWIGEIVFCLFGCLDCGY